MKFSRKKSGVCQLNSLSQEAPLKSDTCSSLSQIYLEQWEKNNNVEMKVKESNDRGNTNSDLMVESLTSLREDKPALPSFSASLKKNKIEQNKKKVNEKRVMDQNVNELIAKNKELQENLEHSRKRTRELIKELREVKVSKKIRREDFNIIQTVLNRYL